MHQQNISQQQHSRAGYAKVFDQRKRRIRGLWERNHSFYAQITVTDEATGKKAVKRVRLEDAEGKPVPTAAEAVKVLNKLKVSRDENRLKLQPKRTPTFAEYADSYLAHYKLVKDAKRPSTLHREGTCIVALKRSMGHLRLRQINKAVVNQHMADRQSQGRSGRTVNLELVTLRNVLRKAVEDGLLNSLNIEGIKWLPNRSEKRRLITGDEIEKICQTAVEVAPITGRNARRFHPVDGVRGGAGPKPCACAGGMTWTLCADNSPLAPMA